MLRMMAAIPLVLIVVLGFLVLLAAGLFEEAGQRDAGQPRRSMQRLSTGGSSAHPGSIARAARVVGRTMRDPPNSHSGL
jgi:hypothetical protein